MPPAPQSLWPSDIRAGIQSPFQILSAQAGALSQQTNRRLIGETRIDQSDDNKFITIHLDMYAPNLDYRHRVLSVSHDSKLVYPVVVDAEMFRPQSIAEIMDAANTSSVSSVLAAVVGPRPKKKPNQASSADELNELIKRVLSSDEIVSTAMSLIARSEDIDREKEAKARIAKDTADIMSAVARQQVSESPRSHEVE